MIFYNDDIHDSTERPDLNYLSKTLRFGWSIFQKTIDKQLQHEDLIVVSLYRKLLEQLDGLFILVDQDSHSAAKLTARATIETYTSIKYIMADNRVLLKERATSYFIFNMLDEHKFMKDIKNEETLGKIFPNKESLNEKIRRIESYLKTFPNYQVIYERKKIIEEEKRKGTNRFVKWYTLYTKNNQQIFTLSDLIKYVQGSKGLNLYSTYSLLSRETHALTAQSDLKITFKQRDVFTNFSELRYRNTSHESLYGMVRAFASTITLNIIDHYFSFNSDEFNEFREFFLSYKNEKEDGSN
ncbi:DUF5677 domain-containing protein [Paenibacillus sp. LPE1-1-1.1]|uniref:DUF5677 domain-containing protein n=1 Tax=Paenibacillus sp. LPE1-1-1.1 TaxID=3135230 RepID=UPI003425EBD4